MKKRVEKRKVKSDSYHHGNLAQECVQQGLKFLARGQMDFSIRDIARAIGVSHGAPSRHFQSKEALMAAIAEEGFRKFNTYLERSESEKDLRARFLAMGRQYIDFALDHPEYFRILFGDKISNHEKYPTLLEEGEKAFRQLLNLVILMQKEKILKPQDPLSLAYVTWSGVHGLANLAVSGQVRSGIDRGLETSNSDRKVKETCHRLIDQMNHCLLAGFSSH